MRDRPHNPSFAIGLLTVFVLILSLALIVCGVNRWRREFTGLHKGWSTLLVSLGIVGAYYAALVIWILRWPPRAM